MAPQKNHFATLGVDIGAGEDEIKRAYRKLAKQWHPDKNKEPGAEDKFKEISASYEYLSSKDRREIYERELRKPKPPPRPSPPSQQSPSYSSSFKSTSTSSNTNGYSSTGKSKASDSKDDGKPKRPSSGPKTKANKKANAGSWSETFTKNFGQKKTQKERPSESRGSFFFSDSHDDDDIFSFTFESFDDRRPSFNAGAAEDILKNFFKPTDMFDDDFFWTVNFGAGFSPPPKTSQKTKSRPRNVAPESGNAAGLDDEYLFSPRSNRRPGSGQEVKVPCPWCGKLFPRNQLDQHEDICGRFDLSDQSDFDSDSDDVGGYSHMNRDRRPSWKKNHEEHLNRVRQDKMRFKDRMASQGKRNSGFVLCPYCERSFCDNAASRHIPFCKEHLRKFGKPLHSKEPDLDSQTYRSHDQDTARDRANKYAKGVPKPSMPSPFNKPSNASSHEDGNARQFPHPKPSVDVDDILGVNGQSFGSSGNAGRTDSHGRTQGRPSYADIHKASTRQAPPPKRFSSHTNFNDSASRKPHIRTGYSHRPL